MVHGATLDGFNLLEFLICVIIFELLNISIESEKAPKLTQVALTKSVKELKQHNEQTI